MVEVVKCCPNCLAHPLSGYFEADLFPFHHQKVARFYAAPDSSCSRTRWLGSVSSLVPLVRFLHSRSSVNLSPLVHLHDLWKFHIACSLHIACSHLTATFECCRTQQRTFKRLYQYMLNAAGQSRAPSLKRDPPWTRTWWAIKERAGSELFTGLLSRLSHFLPLSTSLCSYHILPCSGMTSRYLFNPFHSSQLRLRTFYI